MPGLDEYRQPGTLIGRPRSVRPDQLAESRSPALPYRVQQLIFAHVQHFVYKPAYEVELRSEGVVRAISAGMNKSAMLARFLRETAADVVISPVAIPFLNRMRLTTCLPAAAAEGKRVVSVGVFNSAFSPAPQHRRGRLIQNPPRRRRRRDRPKQGGLIAQRVHVGDRLSSSATLAASARNSAHPRFLVPRGG
jgi:hypothetical protein